MTGRVVVGIDVGAPRKGFHAVALRDGRFADKCRASNAREIVQWCREAAACVVAIDAPCRWRTVSAPRAAERELAGARISCFSTPTEEKARGHAFYTWMLAGAELYAALGSYFPLFDGAATNRPTSIETFPHAVACSLAGKIVSAKDKMAVRCALLQRAGFNRCDFVGIDEIDAGLCALAADAFALGSYKAYGDAADGFIIVPSAVL